MTERVYCCEQSPNEPLAGTADEVDVWVMLEYRPVWGPKALADNELAAPVRAWLAGQIEALRGRGLKVRAQFIRQPEIDRADTRLLVAHAGNLVALGSTGYQEMLDADIGALIDGGGQPIDEPQYFVCTNGQRDLCCARAGLPAYRELRERLGERVWQTTHLGGHRFAPNVLVLPQGALYGRVGPESIDAFVAEIERGELAFSHLRGRACYPPEVQAAEAHLARSDLSSPSCVREGARVSVVFESPAGEVTSDVQPGDAIEVLASCGDEVQKSVTPWRTVTAAI